MTTRRGFLTALLATASLPSLTWADAGGPSYLAAAREPDGSFALIGLSGAGQEKFRIPLPARAHAGAAHPHRPEAIVFARRPGTYALLIDCLSGAVQQELAAPQGHHFSGHGTFSADGTHLFTGEIDRVTGQGTIGVWTADAPLRRVAGFSSGGIGPHELLRLPGQDVLVVANGGIRTSADDGRSKMNIDTMRPNLSYLTLSGDLLDQVELSTDLHKNSIRHLAVDSVGQVAFAMQWQGDLGDVVPLLGLHRIGEAPRLADMPMHQLYRMKGYAGSVAFSGGGLAQDQIALSSPTGGVVAMLRSDGTLVEMLQRPDVCGLSAAPDGFVATDGFGGIAHLGAGGLQPLRATDHAWDNHLVKI